MAVTSNRSIQVQFTGDVNLQQQFSALENAVSSGQSDIISLTAGVNIIIPPTVSGIVNTGVMIVPPAGNTILITLKGAGGDTGIPLHLTGPSSIALDPTFASLVLAVASDVAGVRLTWS